MPSSGTASPSNNTQPALTALLEEYRVLYALVLFRLSALDRRVPVVGAAITGFVAAIAVLPLETRMLVLVVVPLAVVWLLRITINHARSFEDALRRIEAIELQVNGLVGFEAMTFQHQHPSRGSAVGGRTGHETIRSVWTAGMVTLGVCAYFFVQTPGVVSAVRWAYAAYIAVALAMMFVSIVRWRKYHYEPGAVFRAERR